MCGKGGGKGWQMEQMEEEAEMVPHFPAKGSGGDASRLSWGKERGSFIAWNCTLRGLESEILRTEKGEKMFDDLLRPVVEDQM
jgi:hypothetical protein